jgi:hypothetical protein
MDLIFKCLRRKKKLKKPSPSPEEEKAKVWGTFARRKTRAMLAVPYEGGEHFYLGCLNSDFQCTFNRTKATAMRRQDPMLSNSR